MKKTILAVLISLSSVYGPVLARQNLEPQASQKQPTLRVTLQVKGGDRLFADDMLNTLRAQISGVEWVTQEEGGLVVTVERVRHEERSRPERTETITYASHQVNPFGAAFMMPRDASYLYEVTTGGMEIEYGYVVQAHANGKPVFDKLVRGRLDQSWQRCANARVQNVFGGVIPAQFVANPDMEQRCAGSDSASPDTLRGRVLSEVVREVLNIPEIKAAND